MVPGDVLSTGRLARPTARDALLAPLRARTYGTLVYLALAFPLGLVYFVGTTVGLSVGLGLSVLVVGLPVVAATLGGVAVVAAGERLLAHHLLGADVTDQEWQVTQVTGPWDRTVAFLTDVAVWGALVFVLSKLLVGVAAFTLLTVVFTVSLSLLAAPLYYDAPGVSAGVSLPEPTTRELSVVVPWEQFEVGLSFVVRLTSWTVTTLPEAVAVSVLGAAVLLAGLNVLNGVGWLCARWAELTLAPTADDRDGERPDT